MKVKIINGLAGTGKTTLAINCYDSRESIFLAFTRNAAQAFADKAAVSDDSFKTIHSFVSPFAKKILTNGKLRDNKAFNKYCKLIPNLLSDVPYSDDLLHQIWEYSLCPPHKITIDYLHANKHKNDFVYNYEMILIYGLYSLRKQIANPLPNHIKNLIVDEYQDVSLLQYEIIKELVRENTVENLIFLGDANQRIFEFAIGEFNLSQQVHKDFLDIEEISLEKDYRHTKAILSYIDIFAKERCKRLAYQVPHSAKEVNGSVDFVSDIQATIYQLMSNDLQYKEITILSRTNVSCYKIALYVQEKLGYPVNAKFSVVDCILAKLSNSLAAYIKTKGYNDFVKFLGLCRLTSLGFDRGIKSRMRLWELTGNDKKLLDYIKIQLDLIIEKFESGEDCLQCLKAFKPLLNTFVYYANKNEDTVDFIASTTEELNGENISYTIVAESLIIEYFSDILSKTENTVVDIKNKKNGICISTVHRYKGLENKAIIFCPEFQTNSLPYSFSNTDYESEENILYTAITRPLDHLRIVVNENIENLHPSLYKLFPSVSDMGKCGLVNIDDGNLSIPNSSLLWKDIISGLNFNKYSLDRIIDRDTFILLLKELNDGKNTYQLEFTQISNKTVCFANKINK